MLIISQGLAIPLAGLQWLGVKMNLNLPSNPVMQSQQGLFPALTMKWFTWLMQKYVSLRMRVGIQKASVIKQVCNRINPPVSGSCIIVLLHSPWAKLLCEWCKTHDFAIVVASGKWSKRTGSFDVLSNPFLGFRKLIRHLKNNGRVVIIGDVFCPSGKTVNITFLGKPNRVSSLPARIAKCAGVPILTAIPRMDSGMIRLQYGPMFNLDNSLPNLKETMQNILVYFENEICKEPHVWLDCI